jgi:hypothetical protein
LFTWMVGLVTALLLWHISVWLSLFCWAFLAMASGSYYVLRKAGAKSPFAVSLKIGIGSGLIFCGSILAVFAFFFIFVIVADWFAR